mmetsp:Transcript_22309/g.52885  ORF Transcript_22309/g.52885 Transcript_22309/m.52885 type:complete len:388 (+) Transcript_22309:203-1366(+)
MLLVVRAEGGGGLCGVAALAAADVPVVLAVAALGLKGGQRARRWLRRHEAHLAARHLDGARDLVLLAVLPRLGHVAVLPAQLHVHRVAPGGRLAVGVAAVVVPAQAARGVVEVRARMLLRELRVPRLALLARLSAVLRAAVVRAVRLAVALGRAVEAIVAVEAARRHVALAVALAVVDVLGQAAGVAPRVLRAVAAVPVARLDEARLVAVLVAHPAFVAAGRAVLLVAVATVIVAGRRLARRLADTVSDHVLLAARSALALNLERGGGGVEHSDHVLGLVVTVDRDVKHARLARAEVDGVALDDLLLRAHVIHHPRRCQVIRLGGGEGEVDVGVAVARYQLHLDCVGAGGNLHDVVLEAVLVHKGGAQLAHLERLLGGLCAHAQRGT